MNKLKSNIDLKKRRETIKKSAGAWKGTDLDNDDLWKEILKRRSRSVDWFKNWPEKWIKK